jgi:hypothetical protein
MGRPYLGDLDFLACQSRPSHRKSMAQAKPASPGLHFPWAGLPGYGLDRGG